MISYAVIGYLDTPVAVVVHDPATNRILCKAAPSHGLFHKAVDLHSSAGAIVGASRDPLGCAVRSATSIQDGFYLKKLLPKVCINSYRVLVMVENEAALPDQLLENLFSREVVS